MNKEHTVDILCDILKCDETEIVGKVEQLIQDRSDLLGEIVRFERQVAPQTVLDNIRKLTENQEQ